MRISTRLKLGGLLSVGVVAVIGAVLLSTTHQVRLELTKTEAAAELLKGATAVRYLTLEYVLRHEERAQAQWRLRHASLSKLLANTTEFTSTEEQAIVDGLRRTHESVDTLFTQLVTNHENRENEEGKRELLEELETRLTGQITNKTQTMIADAQALSEHSRAGVLEHQQRASLAVMSFGGIVVAVVAATLFLTLRSVTRPLAKLREGTAIVGAGNLDFRLDVTASDEIGDLSRAFDMMTGRLKETIAERKRAEEALRESEQSLATTNRSLETRIRQRTVELEDANNELEAFSYSVSHDLRAPLRHIDGFAELMTEECGSRLNVDGRRYLGIISESVKQMGKLIDDLLAFSRMGRVEMRQTRVSMAALVKQVVQELAGDIDGRKIEWEVHSLPDVRGDSSMLKQVWMNLLSNSIKYTRPRDLAKIDIGCSKKGGELEFYVRDNGAGFEMKYADKLFGVFQRLHRAEEFEGTGVGLANVSRIVARHGGRTWAQAKVDEGATFYFTFPDSERNSP